MFLLNILLALAWAALTADFSPVNLVAGFALGMLVLWVLTPGGVSDSYVGRCARAVRFAGFFAWELAKANVRVASAVLRAQRHLRPAVVAIPLSVHSDVAIELLAALITLTPGTLSLDVSSDRSVLYVHAIDVGAAGVEPFRHEVKATLERRVMELCE